MALVFTSQVEAWDSAGEAVTFVAEDVGTGAVIACAVTAGALVQHFDGPRRNAAELISVFRRNREVIEQIASVTYDLNGRRGPVILRANDFVGRLKSPPLH